MSTSSWQALICDLLFYYTLFCSKKEVGDRQDVSQKLPPFFCCLVGVLAVATITFPPLLSTPLFDWLQLSLYSHSQLNKSHVPVLHLSTQFQPIYLFLHILFCHSPSCIFLSRFKFPNDAGSYQKLSPKKEGAEEREFENFYFTFENELVNVQFITVIYFESGYLHSSPRYNKDHGSDWSLTSSQKQSPAALSVKYHILLKSLENQEY